jgi:hypothetical protein
VFRAARAVVDLENVALRIGDLKGGCNCVGEIFPDDQMGRLEAGDRGFGAW